MFCFQLPRHLSDSKSVGHFHLLKYFIHRLLELEESLPRGHLHSSASRQEGNKSVLGKSMVFFICQISQVWGRMVFPVSLSISKYYSKYNSHVKI